MAWVHIKSTTYNGASESGLFEIQVHYDNDSDNETSMKIRFKANRLKYKDSSYAANGYYLLVDPGSDSEKLYTIKSVDAYWSSAVTTEITVTKKYSDKSFDIPSFWICNTGSVAPSLNARTIKYGSYSGSMYGCFKNGGQREGFVSRSGATSQTGTVATNGTAPTLSVTDTKNNTAILSGALGKNGDNNKLKSATLYYTTDGSDPSSSGTRSSIALTATSGASYSKSINIAKACTVKAYVVCEFKYNTTNSSASSSIIYYTNPGNPGIPKISYTKSRLTIKENWTYTWTAAAAGNSSSPIKGYRIRLYKNGSPIKGLTVGSGNNIGKGTDTNEYIDRESTSCTVIFNPATFDFKPGDKVKLGIYAYTKNGAGGLLFNGGGGTSTAQVISAESVVQNAGIVRVKPAGTWVEGQVYIKNSGTWVEAETVSIKADGVWHESE